MLAPGGTGADQIAAIARHGLPSDDCGKPTTVLFLVWEGFWERALELGVIQEIGVFGVFRKIIVRPNGLPYE